MKIPSAILNVGTFRDRIFSMSNRRNSSNSVGLDGFIESIPEETDDLDT